MNIATLKSALQSRIYSEMISELSGYLGITDDNRLTGYTIQDYLTHFSTAIATAISDEVITHIITNARCSGSDSNGDSHNNVQIV